MSDISDILKLAEAINKKSADDKDFKDLLGEVSAALADILEAMKKPEDKRDEQAEADAMGKAIGAALADALKSIKPPTINVPAPTAASTSSDWKSLRVTPVRNGMGNATSYEIEKIK